MRRKRGAYIKIILGYKRNEYFGVIYMDYVNKFYKDIIR